MQEAGFEPAPSKRVVPETTALDHSATPAYTRREDDLVRWRKEGTG